MVLAQVLYGWADYIDFRWQSSTSQAPGGGGVGRGLALHDLWHGESGRDDSCSIRRGCVYTDHREKTVKTKSPEAQGGYFCFEKWGQNTFPPQQQPIGMFMIIINDEHRWCLAGVRCSVTFY